MPLPQFGSASSMQSQGLITYGGEAAIIATARKLLISPAVHAVGSEELEVRLIHLKQSKPVFCSLHEGICQLTLTYPILYPHRSFEFV